MLAGDGGQHRGRALHRRALQQVRDGAQAAQFFTAAGAPRAAVLQEGQRRAMAGRFSGGLAVQHMQAAVQRRHHGHHAGGRRRLFGDQRGDQAALAARGQRQRFVDAVVGHQRADRAESLNVVHGGVGAVPGEGIAGDQQRGLEERAARRALAHRRKVSRSAAIGQLRALAQQRHALGHVGLLRVRGQRAHAHALDGRVTHDDLGQARLELLGHGVQVLARHDGAADGGALLAGLHRHFAGHFLDEEVEFFVVRRHVRGQDGAVQRVGLGVEGDAVADEVRVHAQLGGGVGGAGEGHHVRAFQAVEQVARATDDKLQRARRQDAGVIDQTHHGLGQVAGGCGGLADAGHAGQEAGRELFEQAPDGEVEGVDVHRQPATRHQDVRAGKAALLAQRHRRAFVDQVAAGQLGLAQAGIGEQRAGATFNIDPAVGARGAGVRGDGVERLFVVVQVLGQRLQARGALLEVQRQQARQSGAAGVVHGFGKVQRLGMGMGHGLAVKGAAQGLGRLLANPAAADETLKKSGHCRGF